MELTELYRKGEENIRQKGIGLTLDAVETGFIQAHDRRVLDRYTFRQQCIDGVEATTACRVLGVSLATPIIMSAITMPIPAIVDDGLIEVANGLKEAGSLMWTGTPVPKNLKELVATGIPVAANVKPFEDRKKFFDGIDEILEAGVTWVGIEIDADLCRMAFNRLHEESEPLFVKTHIAFCEANGVEEFFNGSVRNRTEG